MAFAKSVITVINLVHQNPSGKVLGIYYVSLRNNNELYRKVKLFLLKELNKLFKGMVTVYQRSYNSVNGRTKVDLLRRLENIEGSNGVTETSPCNNVISCRVVLCHNITWDRVTSGDC